MNRMTHAKEVACQQRIVDHHLQDGVHVACLAQVEQASDSFATAWSLRGVGCHVGIIFVVDLCDFALLGVGCLKCGRFVDKVVALAAVRRVWADSELMLSLLEVLVE